MHELVNFLFEVGYLKNVDRSGWKLLGEQAPESVAEHSFRCAIVGYVLAKAENIDASKVMMMCLFHDVHETRITDLHKIAQKYLNLEGVGEKVTQEQLEPVEGFVGKEIRNTLCELSNQESKESMVARDADILECAMQAREYQSQGYDAAADWFERARESLRTKSAKELLSIIEHSDPNEWWKRLKE